MRRVVVWSWLTSAAVVTPGGAVRAEPPSVVELKQAVEQKEYDLRAARIALMAARVKLALAEGRSEAAAKECRPLIREYEADLKTFQDLVTSGRVCPSQDDFYHATGSIAVARVWLAEAESDRVALRAELPKVIAYCEWRVKRANRMLELGIITDEEAKALAKESEADLRAARKRLAELGKPPAAKKDKP